MSRRDVLLGLWFHNTLKTASFIIQIISSPLLWEVSELAVGNTGSVMTGINLEEEADCRQMMLELLVAEKYKSVGFVTIHPQNTLLLVSGQ